LLCIQWLVGKGDKGVVVAWENVKEKIVRSVSSWEREPRTHQRQRKMHAFNPVIKKEPCLKCVGERKR
jgi:hypothetical protein